MAIVNLDDENFETTVSGTNVTIIDCWAAWCGACATFEPIFQRVAERHSQHTFGKLNTDAEKKLVKKLGIKNIPSLLVYREGILLFQQPGYYEEVQLDDIVQQAESLDMNEVRADIAAEKAKAGS